MINLLLDELKADGFSGLCSQCEFSSVERAINPFSGQAGIACICNAGPDDICLASLAMERDLEIGEVVIPCPHCFADLDGKGGMCDNCGAIAYFAELQPEVKPVADFALDEGDGTE